MASFNLSKKLIRSGPILLLYYLSLSEIDTNFENYFKILTFNLQSIIIYFWVLKRPEIIGNGHIFFAGLINDVVIGFPLGISSISYLVISLVASYIKNMSVHTTLTSDWFTFFIALSFSNLIFCILISNFSNISFSATNISYNIFFTLIFFPFLWLLFNFYNSFIYSGRNV